MTFKFFPSEGKANNKTTQESYSESNKAEMYD